MASINEKIYIGSVDTPTLSFDQRSIENIICDNSVDLICDELSSDVLEVSVFFDDADDVLKTIPYATPIFYYIDNNLVGKYYISKVEREGIKKYLIRSTSLIGLIEHEEFYGGFYTGQTFEDVLYDVLLTNGIEKDKYNVFVPVSKFGVNTYGTRMLSGSGSAVQWKYGMHLEFVLVGSGSSASTVNKSGYIVGSGGIYYTVICYAKKDSASENTYWGIEVDYNYHSYSFYKEEKIIGDGSKIIIDIFPGDRIVISADYIQYNNPTISGHLQKNWRNVAASTRTNSIYLGTAFGRDSQSYNLQIAWEAFKLYDENKEVIVDAFFASDESGSNYYVVNAVDNRKIATTYFEPYGNSIGVVSDFSRVGRSIELYNNIVHGDGVQSLLVRGWIKNTTRREALHQLLFATNVCLLKTANGEFLFTKLSNVVLSEIDENSIYNDSREEVINQAKKISVKEFYYENVASTSQKIFDNSGASAIEGQYVAIFDKSPAYNITAGEGITIIASNCNAAIVTGRGTISGSVYNQFSNVIEFKNLAVVDGKDVSVNNIGLITSVNSDSVLSRLKSYYSGSLTKIRNGIIYNGELCGLKYSFNTLYGIKQAFLTSFKARSSSKVKSSCVFISGFIPSGQSGYTSFFIGTYLDEWIVPASIRTSDSPMLRVNIIGSGSDGTSGSSGVDGSASQTGSDSMQSGNGGKGGSGGTGGNGGKIYSITVDVTNINKFTITKSGTETVISAYNDGGTVVSSYSSASGNRRDAGFINVFTGIIYARKGVDGFAGGDGGKGGWYDKEQRNFVAPVSGGDVDVYSGGISFLGIRTQSEDATGTVYYYDSFGGGGGAAYGNNGGNASLFSSSTTTKTTVGGNGADAIVPQSVYEQYGSGGFGGNGGGGGGGAGTSVFTYTDGSGAHYSTSSQIVGRGGSGSAGTTGIDGCVIIYY